MQQLTLHLRKNISACLMSLEPRHLTVVEGFLIFFFAFIFHPLTQKCFTKSRVVATFCSLDSISVSSIMDQSSIVWKGEVIKIPGD